MNEIILTNETQRTINLADELKQGIDLWPNVKAGFADQHKNIILQTEGISPAHKILLLNTIDGLIQNSPLPPMGFENFFRALMTQDQITLQEISCLNFRPSRDNPSRDVIGFMSQRETPRWFRFLQENQDMFRSISESGTDASLRFVASDLLDFIPLDQFALPEADILSRVEQNKKIMTESLTATFVKGQQAEILFHSEILSDSSNSQLFDINRSILKAKSEQVRAFRKWLIENFGKTFPYLTQIEESKHIEQLTNVMALYAFDHQVMHKTTKDGLAVSVSLSSEWQTEWITEKIACHLLGVPVCQITPFTNTGRWWHDAGKSNLFSFRAKNEHLRKLTPEEAFSQVMRTGDQKLLAGVDLTVMSTEQIIAHKKQAACELLKTVFDDSEVETAKNSFENSLSEKGEEIAFAEGTTLFSLLVTLRGSAKRADLRNCVKQGVLVNDTSSNDPNLPIKQGDLIKFGGKTYKII